MIASYNDLDEDVIVRHGVGMWNVFYANQSTLVNGPIRICEAMAYIPVGFAARVFKAGGQEADVFIPGAQESH